MHETGLISLNVAFLLVVAGVLGIYGEFLRPGKVWPGTLGSMALAFGAYRLWEGSHSKAGLGCLAAGAFLLLAETFLPPRFIFGIAGTGAAAVGFATLFDRPARISPGLAIPLSVLLGALTTLLADTAKTARRNKRAELSL